MIIKRRYFIRKDKVSDIQKQIGDFVNIYPDLWPKKTKLEVVETDEDVSFILIKKKPVFFLKGERYFPTLKAILDMELNRKTVVVDEGAVRFVVNGADIMKPGIVDFEKSIKKDEIVIVVEEKHRKPLAVGISLLNAEDLDKKKTGKSVKNIHYVGDRIWDALEKV